MSTDPTNPAPPQPPAAPAPPAPGASRDEWRAWRHANRDYVRAQRHGYDQWGWWTGWGLFWPAALILAGVYFLLSNLGLLSWLRGDVFWPVVLILLGVFLIFRRGRW